MDFNGISWYVSGYMMVYPLVSQNSELFKMAIEIVRFPSQHGDFPVRYVNLYQRIYRVTVWLVVDKTLKKIGLRQLG